MDWQIRMTAIREAAPAATLAETPVNTEGVEAFVRMYLSPELQYTCARTNASTPHDVIF